MDIACVGAVIRDPDGRLCVVRRAHEPSAGLWSIPGGRVETGEEPIDAVRREVREETGLEIDVLAIAGSVTLPAAAAGDRYVVTDYHATVLAGHPSVLHPGDDAADARWVDEDGFAALDKSPGLADTLRRWGVFG